MNVQTSQIREDLKRKADTLHEHAQLAGDAGAYDEAAELYEEARYYTPAYKCRQAAQRLREAGQGNA